MCVQPQCTAINYRELHLVITVEKEIEDNNRKINSRDKDKLVKLNFPVSAGGSRWNGGKKMIFSKIQNIV